VLCITHLPLIAAYAERQLQVAKSVARGRTTTTVTPLSEEERVEEIARLLAGARAGETTRRQARELLSGARSGSAAGGAAGPSRKRAGAPQGAAPRARTAKGKG
jgi:DNA repair protein RecN (Recombination protein N)